MRQTRRGFLIRSYKMALTATSANNAQAASATPRDRERMPTGNVPMPRIEMLALTRSTLTEIARRFLGEKVHAKVLHTKLALHGKHMLLSHN
jgi:hypothetical protein